MAPISLIRVLLIEDSPSDQELIQEYLREITRVEMQLEACSTLTSALEKLAQNPHGYQAILLDLNLPDSHGTLTCTKAHNQVPTIPIIVLTGHDDEETAFEAMKRGAQDYLVKDELTSQLLYRSIRYSIERLQVRQEHWRDMEHLRLVTQQLPAMLWSTDADLLITSTAGTGLVVLSKSSEQMTGRSLTEFFNLGEQRNRMLEAHQMALAGLQQSLEFSVIGQEFHVHLEPLRDDEQSIIGVVGVALDVSDHKRLQDGLSAARKIQESLFPQRSPLLNGLDINGKVYAADATGGDYFDYIQLPGQKMGVIVADVSGHGFGPALLMAEFRAYLRPLAQITPDLIQTFSVLNRLLEEDFPGHHFVTAFLAEIDPLRKTVSYVGAGQRAYLLTQEGDWTKLDSTGRPLGLFPDSEYEAAGPILLRPGELLLIITDGFQEAQNTSEEMFGIDRVKAIVEENRQLNASEIVEELYRQVLQFMAPLRQNDDMTAIVIKCQTEHSAE